jgi:O-antigen ligase
LDSSSDIPTRSGHSRRYRGAACGLAGPVAARSSGSRARPERVGENVAGRNKPAWPVVLFIVSLFIPWVLMIGPLNLSVTRFVLLAMLIPCLVKWASGGAGPWRTSDFLLLAYCAWCFLSFSVNHGFSASIEPGGILLVETMGAYLLARCHIRGQADFRNVIRLSAAIVMFLLPFVVFEAVTGRKLILDTFQGLAQTFEFGPTEMRMGLMRAQGPFEHPILFGMFCASLFALTHLVGGKGGTASGNKIVTASVIGATLMSLSSAPIASLVMQCVLMGWNWLLRQYAGRWKMLWALGFAGYLVIVFGSNQTPASFYITYFSFDQGTGWYRLFTWEYATASVAAHPIFGIGYADWVRPKWMASGTIDNFWLVVAVRHGIPALSFMLGAYLAITLAVGFRVPLAQRQEAPRLAYLLCMAVFFFVGSTVYFWAASYVWFLFLLGSGVWLVDAKRTERTSTASACPSPRFTASRLARRAWNGHTAAPPPSRRSARAR